MNLVSEGKVVL